jgi:hypothetical protein
VLTDTNITLVKLQQPTVKGRGFVTSCRSRHDTPQNVDSQPGKDKAPAGIPPFILDHDTFVSRVNSPGYTLHRRLGRPRADQEALEKKKTLLPEPGIERFLTCPFRNQVTTVTELSRLHSKNVVLGYITTLSGDKRTQKPRRGVTFHRWVRILRDGRPRKRVRFTVNATDFSPLRSLRIDSGAHPTSHSKGTGMFFSGGNAAEA